MAAVRDAIIVAVTLGMFGIGAMHCRQSSRPLEYRGSFPEPKQTKTLVESELGAPTGYRIVATDEFEIMALVLSRKRYRTGREADVSPLDLALAWGPAAEEPILSNVSFSQGGRWYYFRSEDESLSVTDVSHHSANVHIIPQPGDPSLESRLLGIKRGEAVHLKGYLVKVSAEDGWRWNSSRTRTDSGNGSCEILYVTELSFLD